MNFREEELHFGRHRRIKYRVERNYLQDLPKNHPLKQLIKAPPPEPPYKHIDPRDVKNRRFLSTAKNSIVKNSWCINL